MSLRLHRILGLSFFLIFWSVTSLLSRPRSLPRLVTLKDGCAALREGIESDLEIHDSVTGLTAVRLGRHRNSDASLRQDAGSAGLRAEAAIGVCQGDPQIRVRLLISPVSESSDASPGGPLAITG